MGRAYNLATVGRHKATAGCLHVASGECLPICHDMQLAEQYILRCTMLLEFILTCLVKPGTELQRTILTCLVKPGTELQRTLSPVYNSSASVAFPESQLTASLPSDRYRAGTWVHKPDGHCTCRCRHQRQLQSDAP